MSKSINEIRSDFPIITNLNKIYLDNAATTYKPQTVIDAVVNYYTNIGVNVGRGDYMLAYQLEQQVTAVRGKIADFIGSDPNEVVFTSGASESLNMIAYSYGLAKLKKGDIILTSQAEHASNLLPWFKVAEKTGAIIKYIPLDEVGRLTLTSFKEVFTKEVKVITLAQVTNVLAYQVPIKEISAIAHTQDTIVVVDGAQSVPHFGVDVKDADIDFLAFSAHKMCGPTGVGVLYGKYELLDEMDPYMQGGGSNSRYDSCGNISYKKPPAKFEAGTMPIEAILGFGAAVDYMVDLGMPYIIKLENELHHYMIIEMSKLDNIEIYNASADGGIVAFNVKGIFSQDAATYLDTQGVEVRAGHHCSKIIHEVIDVADTLRASISFYNTKEEIDALVEALKTTTLENCLMVFG